MLPLPPGTKYTWDLPFCNGTCSDWFKFGISYFTHCGFGLAGCLPNNMFNKNEDDAENCPAEQDKYLGNSDKEKLKKKLAEESETIESLKTPGGRSAGGYDLYVKPNGDIVVKPKGGAGPGEPTGWNVNDL